MSKLGPVHFHWSYAYGESEHSEDVGTYIGKKARCGVITERANANWRFVSCKRCLALRTSQEGQSK